MANNALVHFGAPAGVDLARDPTYRGRQCVAVSRGTLRRGLTTLQQLEQRSWSLCTLLARENERERCPWRQGEDGVCFICLDTSPSPIQSGCACRGAAGLAHLSCRVEAAEALVEQTQSPEWWWTCQTCKQQFTGEMRNGLANAWWSRVCDRAEDARRG